MATHFGHAFTAELTTQDVKAFSKAIEVFQGVRQRRKVAAAAAAVAADAGADDGGQAPTSAAAAAVVDGVRREVARNGEEEEKEKESGKWNLEKEVELMAKARKGKRKKRELGRRWSSNDFLCVFPCRCFRVGRRVHMCGHIRRVARGTFICSLETETSMPVPALVRFSLPPHAHIKHHNRRLLCYF